MFYKNIHLFFEKKINALKFFEENYLNKKLKIILIIIVKI